MVATSSRDKTAQLWNVETGNPAGSSVAHGDTINWLGFLPAGDRFATASEDETVRVWDVQTQQPLSGPMVHGGPVNHLDFNDDGGLLATSSENGEVRIWAITETDLETDVEEMIQAGEQLGRHRVTENGLVVRIPR